MKYNFNKNADAMRAQKYLFHIFMQMFFANF